MTVKSWEEAEARLIEKRPEFEGETIRPLWSLGDPPHESFAFIVKAMGRVSLIWVGPRGAVNRAWSYSRSEMRLIIDKIGGLA